MSERIPCPVCDSLGVVEDRLPARSYDEEPRYRRRPCDECEGRGEIEVSDETARVVALVNDAETYAIREALGLRRQLVVERGRRAEAEARIRELEATIAALSAVHA